MKKIIIILIFITSFFYSHLCYSEDSKQLNIIVNKNVQKNVDIYVKNWLCGVGYEKFVDDLQKDNIILKFFTKNLSYDIEIKKIFSKDILKSFMIKDGVWNFLKKRIKKSEEYSYPKGKVICKTKSKDIDEKSIEKLVLYAKKIIKTKFNLKPEKIKLPLKELKEKSYILDNCFEFDFINKLINERKKNAINFLNRYNQIKKELNINKISFWKNLY